MRNLPVNWSEGMFLQPHHFQAADRYWAEVAHTSEIWDHPYSYGVRRIEFSHDALANFQLQVNTCCVRLRDGTIISLEDTDQLERRDLKEPFASQSTLRVFIAVPKVVLGRANLGTPGNVDNRRYLEGSAPVPDENTGGNERELSTRDLNARLLLETDDLEGYEYLPIAQVRRAGETEASPQLDDSYIPPLLAVDVWPPLAQGIVRAIFDRIGERIETLSNQAVTSGLSFSSQEVGELEHLMQLTELNQAYVTQQILSFARGIHPFQVYLELVRLVGTLAIFRPDKRPPEDLPNYDHDDLARIFAWLQQEIYARLGTRPKRTYEQRFFLGDGPRMRVALDHRWLATDWEWYVGVLRGELLEEQCGLMLSKRVLDCKLGSAAQVDKIFEKGLEGLNLTPATNPPKVLPSSGNWVYYQVARGGAFWDEVLKTETLAMRFNERLVANLASLQDQREMLVSVGGREFPLQFALFAVPTKS